MNNKIIILILLFTFNVYAQDTLLINEVLIKENPRKKPKSVKIKIGVKERTVLHNEISDEEGILYPLNIPYGKLEEITLYFSFTNLHRHETNIGRPIIQKTEFELNIFQQIDNKKFKVSHEKPIKIILEESKKGFLKKKIDLSQYELAGNNFLIELRRFPDESCKNCYFYAAEHYRTQTDKLLFAEKLDTGMYKILEKQPAKIGLKMKVKVLTQYY